MRDLKGGRSAAAAILCGAFLLLQLVTSLPAAAAGSAFVGMHIQGVSQAVADALGLGKPRGVLVRDVALGGPAAEAGFQRGDLILRFAGRPVATFDGLVARVQGLAPGKRVPVQVLRSGSRVELTLRPGTWPEGWRVSKGAFVQLPAQGLTLAAITPKVREGFDLRWGTVGVVVSMVAPDKSGARVLRRGDVIRQVNQRRVWQPAQVEAELDAARDAGRKEVLLLIEGPEGFRFSLLPVR